MRAAGPLATAVGAFLSLAAMQVPQAVVASIDEAEALWSARRPRSYEFTIEIRQFSMAKDVSFRVVDDRSVVTDPQLNEREARQARVFESIDALFRLLRVPTDMSKGSVSVTFDDTLGYPVAATVYRNTQLSDNQQRFRIVRFERLDADAR